MRATLAEHNEQPWPLNCEESAYTGVRCGAQTLRPVEIMAFFCRTGRRDAICPFIKYVIRKNSCHTKGLQSKIAPPLFSNYIVCPGCGLSCVEAGGKSIMQMAWRCRHNQPARVAQINNQLTCNSLCERSGSPLCDHCITQQFARMAYHLSFLCTIYNSMAKKIRVNVCGDQNFCDWLFSFRGKPMHNTNNSQPTFRPIFGCESVGEMDTNILILQGIFPVTVSFNSILISIKL